MVPAFAPGEPASGWAEGIVEGLALLLGQLQAGDAACPELEHPAWTRATLPTQGLGATLPSGADAEGTVSLQG